jgi:hypothetical protein
MSAGPNPLENETSKSGKAPENGALTDLEQHISQRINRLSDTAKESPHPQLEVDEAESSFIPPFEPVDPYDFPSLPGQDRYSQPYHSFNSSWESSEDLLKAVHDLNDLLTESILNLNVRLTCLEENLDEHSQVNAQQLQKSLKEFRALMQNAKGLPPGSAADKDAQSQTASYPAVGLEMQQQMQLLESRLQQMNKEMEQRHEKRLQVLSEQLRQESRVLERLLEKDRNTSQRHFFSLAILFIMVVFISSALMTNSLDRLASFLTQQQDALHMQLEELLSHPVLKQHESSLQSR